jgi:hypothetical protein
MRDALGQFLPPYRVGAGVPEKMLAYRNLQAESGADPGIQTSDLASLNHFLGKFL